MLKLSEIRGEAALDVLADIMEPAVEIMTDKDVKTLFRAKKKVEAIALMIKNHKRATIAIMAALNQKSVDEFMAEVNIITLPLTILNIMNDPDLASLFTSQGLKKPETDSGSAMENTEASAQ